LRVALILAAERLVAQHGFGGVTLREITASAGARNASAVRYHFGSLARLYAALFEYRFRAINPRRLAEIESLDPSDLRGHAGAMVRPLASELIRRPEGNHYLRFLERVMLEAPDIGLEGVSPDLYVAINRVDTRLRALLAKLPKAIIDARLSLSAILVVSGLADVEASMDQPRIRATSQAILIETLIDGISAILTAPVSSYTKAALALPPDRKSKGPTKKPRKK
jgi:AcrR family transcriptional regulator